MLLQPYLKHLKDLLCTRTNKTHHYSIRDTQRIKKHNMSVETYNGHKMVTKFLKWFCPFYWKFIHCWNTASVHLFTWVHSHQMLSAAPVCVTTPFFFHELIFWVVKCPTQLIFHLQLSWAFTEPQMGENIWRRATQGCGFMWAPTDQPPGYVTTEQQQQQQTYTDVKRSI